VIAERAEKATVIVTTNLPFSEWTQVISSARLCRPCVCNAIKSKLHKDAAAEANNVIIGRTWLDADQVRAGEALGLSKADRLKLRDVGQGEFYASGPVFGHPGVVNFRSDQVCTTHSRPGQRHLLTAPAPSRAIRGVERAVTAAVERERIASQRKMVKGRSRFGRLVAVLASTGQSLEKVKKLLEETERKCWPRRVSMARPIRR
jgi:hypothetical protein